MGRKRKEITGSRFGKLVVIGETEPQVTRKGNVARRFICECDCGKRRIFSYDSLRLGHVTSCGCDKKRNRYDLSGEYGKGYVKGNRVPFLFDLEDYEMIKDYSWHDTGNDNIGTKKNGKIILLHRLIMKPEGRTMITHINGNRRDNRKNNLRTGKCHDFSVNRMNSNNKTGHCGVCWVKRLNRYAAYIGVDGRHINLGVYLKLEDAVKARKDAERKYYG